ncbi:MAG TPA: TraM recognition domain-containing protein [Acidimicrobiales bacterium]|nr:TraM recognition domain-containing protein [Acidimicrobiales bacterium]
MPGIYLGGGVSGPAFAEPEDCVLVLGPPRTGKTTSIVIPNVLMASGPVVVTSTKPDVLSATWYERSRRGACLLFDPSGSLSGPVPPIGWSPLQSSRTYDGAVLMAKTMVDIARPGVTSDSLHWNERAMALLGPLFHAAAADGRSMRDLLGWVDLREAAHAKRILAGVDAELASRSLRGILLSEEREQSGIWSTAASVLAGFRTESALRLTEGPLLDAEAFVAAGSAGWSPTLYVCASGARHQQAAPLVAGLLSDVRDATYRLNALSPTGRGRPATLFVLDELANIAPLPDLPHIVAEGGGQGLITLACLQDMSQARSRWPGSGAGFLSQFGTKVILPGIADIQTLQAISTMIGDRHVEQTSTTRRRGRAGGVRRQGSSTTSSTRREPIMPPSAVREGLAGLALTLTRGGKASWVRMTPYLYRSHAEPSRMSPHAHQRVSPSPPRASSRPRLLRPR